MKKMSWFDEEILQQARAWAFFLLVLIIVVMVVGLIGGFGFRPGLLMLGSIWIFFLPGFPFSYLFAPASDRSIILRVVLTLSFSLVLEPTVLFLLGYLGLPMTLISSIVVATILSAIGVCILILFRRRSLS